MIKRLQELYTHSSKHANYQILASELKKYLQNEEINVISRNEDTRLEYFLENIDIENRRVLDIGGNTGYFSFEFLKRGAKSLKYYEGNTQHSEFVSLSSKVLKYEDKLSVCNEYYNFNIKDESYDIVLLLNVLHHIGDDFGDKNLSKKKAMNTMISSLKNMAKQTDILIFQIGFNWKGNINLPLFEYGTKKELIDFIENNLQEEFEIVNIGIADKINDEVKYSNVNDKNIKRNDMLGEFLNRPIFIMKSKCK